MLPFGFLLYYSFVGLQQARSCFLNLQADFNNKNKTSDYLIKEKCCIRMRTRGPIQESTQEYGLCFSEEEYYWSDICKDLSKV